VTDIHIEGGQALLGGEFHETSLRIEDGEIGVLFDHRGSHHAGIFDVDNDGLRLIVVELQGNLLQV